MKTDTPRTEAARERYYDGRTSDWVHYTICRMIEQELNASQAEVEKIKQKRNRIGVEIRGEYLPKLNASQAEVARLQKELDATCNAEELRQERETRKRAEAEVERLRIENVCLQEIIQELYEWTRRDYPTEQEVREIMDRYHDLLNK